jgi:undecaprenyl-diphosphatase
MDTWLFVVINETLVHPLLDVVMIGFSTVGLVALLTIGGVLCGFSGPARRTGLTILLSAAVSLGLVLVLQYVTLRPRPEAVRQVLSPPAFPSYPSGHAALAFSVAMVLGLTLKGWRWRIVVFVAAGMVAYSRVYLGHHYPSDVLAGGVLGVTVGAAGYGLLLKPGSIGWNWLLWPQIGIAVLVTHIAYLGLLPLYLLRWPYADKTLHFLLFGAIVFWLNLWFDNRMVRLGFFVIPLAIVLPLSIAVLEEAAQSFSPYRTVDAGDLASDVAGMVFFWWLSCRVRRLQQNRRALSQT